MRRRTHAIHHATEDGERILMPGQWADEADELVEIHSANPWRRPTPRSRSK